MYPGDQLKTPNTEGALDVPGRLSTAHVAHGGDTQGYGMDSPGPNSKGDHLHTRHWPIRYPVEGVGVADRW